MSSHCDLGICHREEPSLPTVCIIGTRRYIHTSRSATRGSAFATSTTSLTCFHTVMPQLPWNSDKRCVKHAIPSLMLQHSHDSRLPLLTIWRDQDCGTRSLVMALWFDLRGAIRCNVAIGSTCSKPGRLFETRSIKLNNDRSVSELTKILFS